MRPRSFSGLTGEVLSVSPGPDNNAMNQTNRGVPGMKVGRASGEPVLAEVGPPFMLSLDVAGYCSVLRTPGTAVILRS